jgi:CRP-like cAMP-binding protein
MAHHQFDEDAQSLSQGALGLDWIFREQDGKVEHLAVLHADDYFGEMAVLTDSTRNATVLVRTPMDVLLIPKSEFQLLKSSVPAFGEFFSKLARDRTPPLSNGSSVL